MLTDNLVPIMRIISCAVISLFSANYAIHCERRCSAVWLLILGTLLVICNNLVAAIEIFAILFILTFGMIGLLLFILVWKLSCYIFRTLLNFLRR